MNQFSIKPKIYFGKGSLKYLSELKFKKAFVVTDPFMVTSGFINSVIEQLEKGNIQYEIFSKIVPDPPIKVIVQGIKAMDKCSPDVLIAIGGGSAIDSAKSICQFTGIVKKGVEPNSNFKKPMFIAIPTTSGTGSEVTSFAVITDKKRNVKYPLVDEELLPDAAILDSELVKTVPAKITADTGLDVLTHALEAYVSIKATDYSDALAEKAIKLVFEYLPRAYKNGSDEEAREKMHNASCIAGMAFTNTSLGISHSMAHALGGKFHIPHGRANAILLPYAIEFNANLNISDGNKYSTAAARYAEIAKILGFSAGNVRTGVRSLTNAVNSLIKQLHIPISIKEVGVSKDEFQSQIKILAETAKKDGCTLTNPRIPDINELETLFNKAYVGK